MTMKNYTLELSEVEIACGVTLDQVARELPRVLVRDGRVYIDGNVGPALAGATARAALGAPAAFVGLNQLGMSVYGAAGDRCGWTDLMGTCREPATDDYGYCRAHAARVNGEDM